MHYLTDEENKLIEQAIVFPLVKKGMNLDQAVIIHRFKLKKPYLDLLDGAFTVASITLRKTKSELNKRNINVYEAERTQTFVTYDIFFRGYQTQIQYFTNHLRIKVENALSDCINAAIVQRLNHTRNMKKF